MANKNKSFSNKLLITLLLVIGIFAVTHLLLQYTNITYFDQRYGNFYELTNRFDFDDEASIPTWFSNVLFLALAFCAFLAAKLDKAKKTKSIWIFIGVASIIGSIDEVSTVHESGLQSLHLLFFNENTPTFFANAWIIIVPFIIIFAAIFFYKSVKLLPTKTTKLLAIAVGIYLSGAVGIDIITSTILESSDFVKQGLLVAIEEVAELIGLSIAIYAISSYIENNYSEKVIKSIKVLD